MSRPKLLDVFDPSLSSGETAYNRLFSHVDATVSGNTLTAQSTNINLENGSVLVFRVTNTSLSSVNTIQAGTSQYALRDSSDVSLSQVFPINSRLVLNFDTTNHKAYLVGQSIPEETVLCKDDELSNPTGINATSLQGHTLDEFALKSDTYNLYVTAEVIT